MRHLVTIFAASVGVNLSYCENFKCRVSTENLHYVFPGYLIEQFGNLNTTRSIAELNRT